MQYRYTNFLILLFIPLIYSCSSDNSSEKKTRTDKAFYIEKSLVKKGLLRIHVPEKRPKNLAIQDPNGAWFVLQDSDDKIETMPQEEFDSINIMEFETDKLKGVTWINANKVNKLIFTSQGKYLIYFADNLETEPENTFSLQENIVF